MALFKLVDANFVFCFLKTQCSKDDIKKILKNEMIKKNNKKNIGRKRKINALSAHFSFINNTIEITLPSPNDAIDTQMFSDSTQKHPDAQMLGAFCSITGGQRDFFWFPKFSKKTKQKQTNLFLIPLNFLSGSLTCRIQRNFTWIELISKLSPQSCKPGGGYLPLHLLLLTVILNPKSSPETTEKIKR